MPNVTHLVAACNRLYTSGNRTSPRHPVKSNIKPILINIIPIRIITKIILFLVLIGGILFLIVYSVLNKTHIYCLIVFGGIALAEIAHLIRKTREQEITEKITEKNTPEEKSKNKYLLKHNQPKNETLLKSQNKKKKKGKKSKNESLLGLKERIKQSQL